MTKTLASLPLLALLFGIAATQAEPSALTAAEARHLLIRTGFAPAQVEVERVTGKSAQLFIDDLLPRAKAAKAIHPAPALHLQRATPQPVVRGRLDRIKFAKN